MSSVLPDVLGYLFAGSIGRGIATLPGKCRQWFKQRPLGAFWEFPNDSVVIVRSIATQQPDPDNLDRQVWMSDLFSTMALEKLYTFLIREKLAKKVRIVGCNNPVHEADLEENVIFIGGTRGNPACSAECELLQKRNGRRLPFYWHKQEVTKPGERILRSPLGELSYRTVVTEEPPTVDFGLVVKAENPRRSGRYFYVLAGNLGIGTYAAAAFVTTAAKVKGISPKCKKGAQICFVAQGEAAEFSPVGEPTMVTPAVEV